MGSEYAWPTEYTRTKLSLMTDRLLLKSHELHRAYDKEWEVERAREAYKKAAASAVIAIPSDKECVRMTPEAGLEHLLPFIECAIVYITAYVVCYGFDDCIRRRDKFNDAAYKFATKVGNGILVTEVFAEMANLHALVQEMESFPKTKINYASHHSW